MAEEFVEFRRVVIEYEIRVPESFSRPRLQEQPTVDDDMVDEVRRRLIRDGSRNLDIFGGRA